MKHSKSYDLDPPYGPAGENLYWSSGGSPTAGSATKAWYKEIDDPGCGNPGFPGCGPDGAASGTGHFTAMIWAGVKEIGCASNSHGVKGCRYKAGDKLSSDTPNMQGSYTANVFAPKVAYETCKANIESCFGKTLDPKVTA
jgi:hypothetical protein